MNAIELQNVSRIYKPGKVPVTALDNVSLDISHGEFVVIGGVSGSGKSTLLNLIGLIDAPTQGKVFLHGQEVNHKNDRSLTSLRRHNLGFIFQSFNLIPTLTVFENVEYPLINLDRNITRRRQRVSKMLDNVGLLELARRYPSEISGGQQQRVAVARAFAKNPQIVLADEPTANLDSANSKILLDLMRKMNRDDNVTFIMASHDSEILNMSHRQIRLIDGKLI